jgi:uncharacterized phiE125 gp8 family phage protein
MNLRLITASTAEPVSLETAKAYLRVDGTLEDVLIQGLVSAAREQGEELARRAFVTQTWEQTEDAWPANRVLKLYRPPLQSVTSVKYIDRAGVEATWTDYRVDTRSAPGAVLFNTLPGASLQETGAITVRFVAGYGAVDTVPERIKNAILQLVAQWYENRSAVNVGNIINEMPLSSRQAFIAERVVWF